MPIFNPTIISGTANQVLANGNTGTTETGLVTLTLPQSIGTVSSPTFAGLTLTDLTPNSFLYAGPGDVLTSTAAPTNGQLLIGSTGVAPVRAALTAGTAISVTNGAGSITIANTGVTSNVAGTGISVSGATGAVTITNTGVTAFSAGTTGLTPNTGTTGAITLAGTLTAVNGGTGQNTYAVGDILFANTTTALARLADVATGNALISGGVGVAPLWGKIGLTTHVSGTLGIVNGGTGLTTTPANGQLLIGNGTSYSQSTLAAGAGINITNGAGTINVANTGVTSAVAGSGISVSAATGSVTVTNTGVTSVAGTANQILANNTAGTPNAGNVDVSIAPNAVLPGTAGFVAPTGTTAERPVTPVDGQIRFNTTSGYAEIYQLGQWYKIATTATDAPGILAIYTGSIPATSGVSAIPFDNTSPLITEGTEIWTRTIALSRVGTRFSFTIPFTVDCSTSNRAIIAALFRTVASTTIVVGSAIWFTTGGGRPSSIIINEVDAPVNTTPVTYSLRVGIGAGAGTWYVNSTSTGNNLGGTLISTYQILEIE